MGALLAAMVDGRLDAQSEHGSGQDLRSFKRIMEAASASGVILPRRDAAEGFIVPTVEDCLVWQPRMQDARMVSVWMTPQQALEVARGLELFARVGIGQVKEIACPLRLSQCAPASLGVEASNVITTLGKTAEALGYVLTGAAPGNSHSISSHLVDDSVKIAWDVMGAIKHRMAWDAVQSMQASVWHDDVSRKALGPGDVSVLGKTLAGGDGWYLLQFSAALREPLNFGLRCAKRIVGGDFLAVIDMAKRGALRMHDGGAIDEASITACAANLNALSNDYAPWAACEEQEGVSGIDRLLNTASSCMDDALAMRRQAAREIAAGVKLSSRRMVVREDNEFVCLVRQDVSEPFFEVGRFSSAQTAVQLVQSWSLRQGGIASIGRRRHAATALQFN